MKYTKPIMLAILAVFLSASLTMAAGSEIRMLRASKTPPPEMQKAEQMANEKIPAPSERRLTVEELKQKLGKIPGERKKLENIKAGVKGTMRRASKTPPPPPPEMQKEEQMARQKIPAPSEKRLTVEELMRELEKIPGEREKLDKVRRGFKPTSSWLNGIKLSWLNPLSPREAHAATAITTSPSLPTRLLPVHITLNGWNGGNMFYSASPYAKAIMYGLYPVKYGGRKYPDWSYQQLRRSSSYNPKAYLYFGAPYTGLYIITFYAYGKVPAHMNHWGGTGPGWLTIASWNFSSSTSGWNYYTTIQHLEQGLHYFQWYPDSSSTLLRHISIDSY